MSEKILKLKKLNAAYIAALEFDYCPDPSESKKVLGSFEVGITESELETALSENQGRRPDELAGSISDLILTLNRHTSPGGSSAGENRKKI